MNYFHTRYTYDKNRAKVWKAICEYLQKFIPIDSTVLEFGAGYCDFINQIKARNKIAVDINPMTKRYCHRDVQYFKSIDSVNTLQNKPNVIFMSNILEHLDDKELDLVFKKFSKIVKSGGTIIIIQPNYLYSYKYYWDDYTHKKAFSHISLCDFLRSKGLNIVRLEKQFLPLTMKSFIPKSYFLTKLYLMCPIKIYSGQMLVIAKFK